MLVSAIQRATYAPRTGLGRAAGRLISRVLDWQDRANQRHQLRGLSDFMLKDLGLTRADVEGEASKPFWMR